MEGDVLRKQFAEVAIGPRLRAATAAPVGRSCSGDVCKRPPSFAVEAPHDHDTILVPRHRVRPAVIFELRCLLEKSLEMGTNVLSRVAAKAQPESAVRERDLLEPERVQHMHAE